MWSIKFIYFSILGQFDCLCVSLCFTLHFSRYSSGRSMTDGQKILVMILCCLLMSIPFTHFPCSALCTTNRRHFQVHINCCLQLRLQLNKFMMHCSWTGNVEKSDNNKKLKPFVLSPCTMSVKQVCVRCGWTTERDEMKNLREKIASKHVITKNNSATLYTTSHLSQVTSNGSGDGNNRVVVALTVTPQQIQRRRGSRRSRCQFQIHFSFSRDCKANITFDRCVRPKYNQQPTTVRTCRVKSVFNIDQKLIRINMIGIVTNCNKFYWNFYRRPQIKSKIFTFKCWNIIQLYFGVTAVP